MFDSDWWSVVSHALRSGQHESSALGKTTELVHCTITGPCLHMCHRPSTRTLQHVTVPGTDLEHLPCAKHAQLGTRRFVGNLFITWHFVNSVPYKSLG